MKTLSTLAFLLITLAASAQSKIEGVGPFKINKTTLAQLPQLAQELGVKFEEVLPDTAEAIQSGQVGRHFAEGSFCSYTKVYTSRLINLAGLDFKNVYLTFYKGNLISFRSLGTPEIERAFTEKYGSGKSSDAPELSSWYNKSIYTTIHLSEDPAKRSTDYFSVNDAQRPYEASQCNKKQFDKIRDAIAKKNGNPLKDL